MRRPAAVLWDFDGTLVDSEGVWKVMEGGFAARHGFDLPADYSERTIGGTMRDTAIILKDLTGTPASLDEIAAEITDGVVRTLARPPFRWCAGAEHLVRELAAEAVPQAIVTTSRRAFIDPMLSLLPAGLFDTVVTFEDTDRHKPDPASYLLACQRLGLAATDCLVVEDSEPGMASGLAAGCQVLGVPSGPQPPPADRLTVLGTLAGLTVADLRGLCRGDA
ncbi:HAD family hydrolase [Propioniciclava tarda]|uniref:HAD family hydrolase n=1 Tax=Propioniciclava tarda TaxID=433330 RepID=UPI001169C852|nr:HAD family phosphatase [Propioniciclava tarda]SMO76425.1 haloacid dehalogenase superfamily, subfamily IA, variant 3 with third motif having DD or ED [Propioniciclava tarda]